jgi:hypothetical protein
MAFINALYNPWPGGDEKIAGLRDGIAAAVACRSQGPQSS